MGNRTPRPTLPNGQRPQRPTPGSLQLDEILSLVEAAQISGLAAHTLAQQAERGKLHARKVGHSWVTTRGCLEAYLEAYSRRHRGPGRRRLEAPDAEADRSDAGGGGPPVGAMGRSARRERARNRLE